ncbi:N-acetylmuramoyl-L-alanine amidase [hydrothermal vent metagenome]|uniref:N-acetylmuramoyl-L-alanine amidase n=1 Tax=hydrothermal vent metagenome TaxID=652676 RepID=A0A1W1BF63_9ZZZZ
MESNIFNKKFILILIILFLSNRLVAGNYFSKSEISQGELRLYFNNDIERVTYFSIKCKDGTNKYVYDIHGGVLPSGKGISHHSYPNIESFRIAQNSSTKLRVVIKSKQKALDKHVYAGKVLVIPLTHGKEATIKGTTISNTTKQSYSSKKNRYIVVIDAGHGGKDNGASCCRGESNQREEKSIVLSVSQRLKKRLEELGYRVYMTRDSDVFVKLPKRTEFANNKKADIFISIHANAAPNKRQAKIFKGIEIYYLSPAQTKRAKDAAAKENSVMFHEKDYYTTNIMTSLITDEKLVESRKLGIDVSQNMLGTIRRNYGVLEGGGVKGANFWVLVGAQMPAILVEIGYISHPIEGKNLLDSYYQKLLVKGIAEGVEQYLNNKR